MSGGRSSPVSGSTIRSSEPANGRPFVVRRRSSGSVVRADRDEPAALRAPERGDLRHVRQPLLHQPQRPRRADGDDEAQRVELGLREARLVLHREPDRLERREGERAALALELVERRPGIEAAADVAEGARRGDAGEDRDEAADVEERERRPEAVVGRQLQRARVVERLAGHPVPGCRRNPWDSRSSPRCRGSAPGRPAAPRPRRARAPRRPRSRRRRRRPARPGRRRRGRTRAGRRPAGAARTADRAGAAACPRSRRRTTARAPCSER